METTEVKAEVEEEERGARRVVLESEEEGAVGGSYVLYGKRG